MKPGGSLVAERPLARHCPELLERGADRAALATALGRMGEALGPALAGRLASLLGDDTAALSCAPVDQVDKDGTTLPPVRLRIRPGEELLLVWFDHASLLALTDRVFGGTGAVPGQLPERLPSAARLLLLRFAELLAQALGEALGRPGMVELLDDPRGRGEQPAAGLLGLECIIRHGQCQPWTFHLALAPAHAERLLLAGEVLPNRRESVRPRGPQDDPFAQVPLAISVTLAQLRLPVARLATLRPGDRLPLNIPREFGLMAGSIQLAKARIGTLDGRYAVQIIPSAQPGKG